MRRDDYKFLLGLALTVLLMAAVVLSSHRRDVSAAAGPTVDLKRVGAMMGQGALSNHEASYWEVDKGESDKGDSGKGGAP